VSGFFDSVARLFLASGRTVKNNPVLPSIRVEGRLVITGASIEEVIFVP
jgi:hypothetical protein